MSNRFRNLKLGRTFNLNNNRLAPLPSEVSSSETSYKVSGSPKVIGAACGFSKHIYLIIS